MKQQISKRPYCLSGFGPRAAGAKSSTIQIMELPDIHHMIALRIPNTLNGYKT